MKLELRVPLDTDLEKVRKLVKSVGHQMLEEPDLADNLLQPLKSQGVHRMEPSAYVIRVKFMAIPGEQFVLRREVFRRLHESFREHGIRLGVSPVMVDGAQSLASAAAAADALAPPPPVPRTPASTGLIGTVQTVAEAAPWAARRLRGVAQTWRATGRDHLAKLAAAVVTGPPCRDCQRSTGGRCLNATAFARLLCDNTRNSTSDFDLGLAGGETLIRNRRTSASFFQTPWP
jgi:hypothetical protein